MPPADAIGFVACPCGAELRFRFGPGTSSPTHYKTWCVSCGTVLEGYVEFETPPSWTPSYLEFRAYLDAELKAGAWVLAEAALGHPRPYSLDELATAYDRLAALVLDPTGPGVDARARAHLRALMFGVGVATLKFEREEAECTRAKVLRAKQRETFDAIAAQDDALFAK